MCLRRAPEKYIAGAALDRAGLVVRAPAYRSRGPGSIPDATRFSEELVGLERGPQLRSGSGLEMQDYGRRGSAEMKTRHPSIRKKRHSIGLCN
jgi:hypothetical protein